MHVAGMASNRGRNLLNVADRAPGGAELAVVITDAEDAPVLERARERDNSDGWIASSLTVDLER